MCVCVCVCKQLNEELKQNLTETMTQKYKKSGHEQITRAVDKLQQEVRVATKALDDAEEGGVNKL